MTATETGNGWIRVQDGDAHRMRTDGQKEPIQGRNSESTTRERVVSFDGASKGQATKIQGWKMSARHAHLFEIDVETRDDISELQLVIFEDHTHLICTEKGRWLTERLANGIAGKARRFRKLTLGSEIPELNQEEKGKKKKEKAEHTCQHCQFTFQSQKGLGIHQRKKCKSIDEMSIDEMARLRQSRRNARVARGTETLVAENVNVRTCNGQRATPCASFIYLGSLINVKGKAATEIRRRIAKAFATFGALSKVWRAKEVQRETKAALYQAIVMTVMLYNAEVWPIKKQDLQTLESAHFRMAKRMLGRDHDEHISREQVFAETGLPRIADYITQKRLRWVGHALRRNDTDRSRQAVLRELEDQDSYWTKLVLRDCEKANHSMEEMMVKAQGRHAFRKITYHGGLTLNEVR